MIKRVISIAMILMNMCLQVNPQAHTEMTKEDVIRTIRDNLEAHNEKFTIDMSTNILQEVGTDTNLLKAAESLDDNSISKDGDYLGVKVLRLNEDWSYDTSGNASMTFTVEYRTTPEQEKQLDDKVDQILKAMDLKDDSDYQKVKTIHDYIINTVSFDHSLERYTAYDALVNNNAVCEGYAAAAYLLLNDSGVESRIISGTAGGGAHIWNIVKVDGKWYNLDLTWDDPDAGNNIISYDYFLKNDQGFSDHLRDPEFLTSEFQKTYSIAAEDYVVEE